MCLCLQEAVINELKSKTNAVREKKLLQQDEVYNGALEDILIGLKAEPYRRADAGKQSINKRRKCAFSNSLAIELMDNRSSFGVANSESPNLNKTLSVLFCLFSSTSQPTSSY